MCLRLAFLVSFRCTDSFYCEELDNVSIYQSSELLWGGNFSTHKTDEAQNDILTNCHLTDELISPVWIRTTAHKLIGMNLYH